MLLSHLSNGTSFVDARPFIERGRTQQGGEPIPETSCPARAATSQVNVAKLKAADVVEQA